MKPIPYTLRMLSLDIRHGRCSGFPWCCITFYVLVWMPLGRFPKLRYAYTKWAFKSNPDWLHNYVTCPRCAKHPIQNIKRCTPACGHHQEWEQLYKDYPENFNLGCLKPDPVCPPSK